jgi:hypothetical protein
MKLITGEVLLMIAPFEKTTELMWMIELLFIFKVLVELITPPVVPIICWLML